MKLYMTYTKKLGLILLILSVSISVDAQSGLEGFNYQTIVRDNAGLPIANKAINFRFTIVDANNSIQYAEKQLITTNSSGLANHVVGKGTIIQGTFAMVPFQNANQILQVDADLSGGNNFQPIGTLVLRSVPYALFAASGNPGPKGDTGAQGPKGDTGAQGPAGPSGIVKVLAYDPAGASVMASLASMTPTVPIVCRTQSYTAGVGEYALINTHGSLYPSNSANGLLLISAGVSLDGGVNFTSISNQSLESMSDGAATAGVSKYYPLTAGQTYIFGTIFESSALVSITLLKATCSCTVTIVKQ